MAWVMALVITIGLLIAAERRREHATEVRARQAELQGGKGLRYLMTGRGTAGPSAADSSIGT